jgi:hypothetical protein
MRPEGLSTSGQTLATKSFLSETATILQRTYLYSARLAEPECLGDQFIGSAARAVRESDGHDHHFLRAIETG